MVSSFLQGRVTGIRKRRRRPPRVRREAKCSSRYRSFIGSAVASSPSSSRTRVQASGSIAARLSSSQTALTAKSWEGKRPKPVALPHRMWSSTVACPRWRTSRNWADPPGVQGVGEEHLMPQALVLVEQGQLGSGVRPLPAHDAAGAVRKAGQIDHASQLGHFGSITQCPVLVQGGMPEAVGRGQDSAADRLGDGVSDREEGTNSSFRRSRTWTRKA